MGRRLLILAALISAPTAGLADEVSLADGGVLTGEVLSMSTDGVLKMRAEVAPEALSIHPAAVRQVSFSKASPTAIDHDARIRLTNGDLIPCDLRAITPERMDVRTSYAGDLSIPRKVIDRLQLGIRPRQVILAGPGDAGDWRISNNDWMIDQDLLVSSGTGHAGRDVPDLPSSFALSFLLKWEQRPAFKVFFCSDPTRGSGGNLDRYYLQFNTSGFELKRQSTGQTSYPGLGVLNVLPDRFEDRDVHIELRVDRGSRMIQLFLDGEFEGRFPDPVDTVPEASGIVFESATSTENGHRVSQLSIRHWDASGDRHESEERGNPAADAIIDHDGQRFSGRLLQTEEREGQTVVLFKSPHLDEPLAIPANRISTLFLANDDGSAPPGSDLFFGLGVRGRISAASGSLDAREIHLEHPLLGPLTLDRAAIVSLERREPEIPEPSEEP